MKPRILHITANESGGAGIACRRLHEALLAAGADSHILYLWCKTESVHERIHSAQQILTQKWGKTTFSLHHKSNLAYNRIGVSFDKRVFLNGPRSLYRLEQLDLVKTADIVHLHWVPKMLHFPTFFADKSKHYIWTMHDMQPFTGGNHYETGNDLTRFESVLLRNEQIKKRALKGTKLQVISPSHWLANLAQQSEVFRDFPMHVLPNPVPTDVFAPIPRSAARTQLGINIGENKKLLLFVAENIQDERKGFWHLLQALKQLKTPEKLALLVIGNTDALTDMPIETHHLGYVSEPEKLALAYNAADAFVIPSLEDNLPNTMVESLACGTPVIGFKIGGIPDLVVHGQTGWLAENIKAGLAMAFQDLLDTQIDRDTCVAKAKSHCAPEVVAEKILKIYSTLLHG
jgi:glycosyltransferase involved in cell wall biosynthesis